MIRLQFLELKQISNVMSFQHSKLFIFCFLTLFTINYYSHAQNSDKFKVVIDAGHGGEDEGINTLGLKEKVVVLNVSLFIEEFLSEYEDIELIYTRQEDEFLKLSERSKIANKANADLFISIHSNASMKDDVNGVETFIGGNQNGIETLEIVKRDNNVIFLEKKYEKTYKSFITDSTINYNAFKPKEGRIQEKSNLLANKVKQYLSEHLNRENRGVKQAKYLLLNNVNMPGIVISLGYLSNMDENFLLASVRLQREMAKEISDAIIEYKAEVKAGTFDLKTENSDQKNTTIVNKTEKAEKAEKLVKVEKPKKSKTLKKSKKSKKTKKTKKEKKSKKTKKGSSAGTLKIAEKTDNDVKTLNTEKIEKVDEVKILQQQDAPQPTYYIQVMTLSKEVELTPENFRGLDQITRIKEDFIYKYRYGKSNSYLEILDFLKHARAQGYNDAFVVAYLDGKPITIDEAFKTDK